MDNELDFGERMDAAGTLDPKDAIMTKRNIAGILKKWKLFCKVRNKGNWHQMLLPENCTKGTCMYFLRFILDNYRVPKSSSINQYWKQFKMLFARRNGFHMDINRANEVVKFLNGDLKKRYGLDGTVKPKPVMGVDDLFRVLAFLWSKDKSVFPNERQRVQLATILLFAAFTASRPGELVNSELAERAKKELEDLSFGGEKFDPWKGEDVPVPQRKMQVMRSRALCYEDICLMVLRDPAQHDKFVLVMAVLLTHHKGSDNKSKPVVFFFHPQEETLVCPITHFLALALHDDAFEARGITSIEQILNLRVDGPVMSTQLKWKTEMLKVPVFRHPGIEKVEEPSKPLSYTLFQHYMVRLGKCTGFEDKLTLYCVRRGTGNAVNAIAPSAVRDQVMRHEFGSKTFQDYLNRRTGCDVQSAFLGQPSIDGLLKAFAYMGISCDPRAPIKMPDDDFDALPPDPRIVSLEDRKSKLKKDIKSRSTIKAERAKGTPEVKEYDSLASALNAAYVKRRNEADSQFRKQYFENRHTADIERQINGIAAPEFADEIIKYQIKERDQLQRIMSDARRGLGKEEIKRRMIGAGMLLQRLCSKREVQPHMRRANRPKAQHKDIKIEVVDVFMVDDPFPLVCNKRQCPICIGDESLTYSQRTFSYCRVSKMMDHVEGHLRKLPAQEKVACRHPKCQTEGIRLDSIAHFKNHVARVHGISLRI